MYYVRHRRWLASLSLYKLESMTTMIQTNDHIVRPQRSFIHDRRGKVILSAKEYNANGHKVTK